MAILKYLLVLLLSSILLSCGTGKSDSNSSAAGNTNTGVRENKGQPSNTTSWGRRTYRVEVAPVQVRDVTYTIDVIGSLEPKEEIKIATRVAGIVEDVRFEEGDAVTKNTVLVDIDTNRYTLAVKRSKASLEKTIAELQEAQSALNKRKALRKIEKDWITDEEIATFTASVDKANAVVEEAKAALEIAEQDRNDSHIRPPISGVINSKLVSKGEYLAPGAVIAIIVDIDRLRLRFKVTESEAVKVTPKSIVTFRVRAMPSKVFKADIYHISESADPTTRMIECFAWVNNTDRMLKAGFSGDVNIETERHKEAVLVPEYAVLPSENGFIAFVVENSKAIMRRLQLGMRTKDGYVEVLSGLKAGEI
ncbi:MAG: hypothetical protein A2W23_07465, partial [Planctomycetes bacterium RBG_16_43_13]